MLKIINNSLQLQAVIENVLSPLITEEINGEFSFGFSAIIDGEKSHYINTDNIAVVEDNYFNIIYSKEQRHANNTITTSVKCEHVSYDLGNEDNILDEGFVAYGTPEQVLTQLLQGSNFTIGQVDFTAAITVAIKERVTKRGVLIYIAGQLGGELKFSKYQISILSRRGADRGVQFRYAKNNISVSRITDKRKLINGQPTVSYEVDVAELEFADGYGNDEHYELGDTVQVIDPDLKINTPQRIIKESHNPFERGQGSVTIANFVPNISNSIAAIQSKAVMKNTVYNGCNISPEKGFESERSDKKAKATMNATEGYKLETGDGNGTYTPVFYIVIEEDGTAKLYLGGNAVFSGKITAADIEGSDITGGTINVETDLHVGDNIYLGNISSLVVKKIIFNEHTNFETIPSNNGLKLNFGVLDFIGAIHGGWYFGTATDVSGLEAFGYVNQENLSVVMNNHIAEYHT
jgi:hypothetical protein